MSKIEWTGETWNPIVGCSVVSPGCTNCYAMKDAWRKGFNPKTPQYHGLTRKVNGKPVWTGEVRMADHKLTEPLKRRKPTTYFVNSMGDLFHEYVPDDWIDRVFAVMALCPQHIFQVLTKRSARMQAYLNQPGVAARVWDVADRLACEMNLPESHPGDDYLRAGKGQASWPLPNVWLGVSAEDQRRADERIPDLLETPAAVRFVSYEPALGPVDFTPWLLPVGAPGHCVDIDGDWWHEPGSCPNCRPGLDWVIVGGESGPGARPCNVEWIRQTVAQCKAAGVACFVKQVGSCFVDERNGVAGAGHKVDPDVQITRRLRDRKGGDMAEWPADLRVRQMPERAAP